MAKNSMKKDLRLRHKKKEKRISEAAAKEARRAAFDNAIREDKARRSSFYKILRDACENPLGYAFQPTYTQTSVGLFAKAINDKKFGANERKSLSHLIEVCRRSKLVEYTQQNDYINGLVNLSKWWWMWKDNPDFWSPKSKNIDRQFASLARHLLCKYQVPAFMDKVWYKIDSENELYQEWFINLGQGENIRKQRFLPIELTKKMGHHFLEAPNHFTVKEAIRWGQVKGVGGDHRTALGILSTPLSTDFSNNEFWTSVIRFFIDNPMMDTNQYGPICDYIRNQKFHDRGQIYVDNELVHLGPTQPNFSMHRRDPNVLLRQVEDWHRELREMPRFGTMREDCSWSSCGIPGFIHKGKEEINEIVEILSSRELYAEGEIMKHCVGSYVDSCKNNQIAIYSYRRIDVSGIHHEATLEVRISDRTISQARKKCNAPLTAQDWSKIREWINKVNLQISKWIQ